MDYIKKLRNYSKKMIDRQEMYQLFQISEDSDLYDIVEELCRKGILAPVKRAGTNGNRKYPLYRKYRITFSETENAEQNAEIDALHPLLHKNSYLKQHPEIYSAYRSALLKLDRFLFSGKDISIPVSRKERSFEIFGEEKMLDDRKNPDEKPFVRLLARLGIDQTVLSYYDTPEYCFHDYIPVRKDSMTILILENKDIWFNLRRMMFEFSADTIFGTKIDGVLYGQGKKITGADYLVQYHKFLGCSDVRYLYWGDIDREGLNIYCALVRICESCDVQLFVPAYEKMLALSEGSEMPDSTDNRNRTDDYSRIFAMFDERHRDILMHSLDRNKRIPQEIISFAWLKENMV